MNHLRPANVARHVARLRLLVENAGIKIVQVPTLTENTRPQQKSSPSTEREFLLAPKFVTYSPLPR